MSATAASIETARRHAEATVKRSGTSFAAGMAILPKKRREAMHAVYAFCREVDDIADDDGATRSERMRRLAEWREEIDRLFEGRPQFPAGLALLEPVRSFDLAKREFLMMIEGMEMDADGPIVAPTMAKLLAYTRRVAGSVGLLSMPCFGAPKIAAADDFALALGDALQLTNILRDVAEDAAIGRLYLPAELLEKHGVPKDPARVIGADGLPQVAAKLGALAREKFARARAALKSLDWRTVRPALLMMGVYEAYLARMEARGWEKTGAPLSINSANKMMIAARWYFAPQLSQD